MKVERVLILSFLLVFLATAAVYAVSPLELSEYLKAVDLRSQAVSAMEKGEYDRAYRLAEDARLLSQKAIDAASGLVLRTQAEALLKLTGDKIESVKRAGGMRRDAETIAGAVAAYSRADSSFSAGEYGLSIQFVSTALTLLGKVRTVTLPRYYTVRSIPGNWDCFWKIAAYPFIYGDASKWPVIYRANRETLRYPDNPDLIFPGQIFLIPSINGEVREGMYDPDKEY